MSTISIKHIYGDLVLCKDHFNDYMGDGRNPSKNESEIVGKLVLTEHDIAVLRILFRLKKDQWLTFFEIVEAVEDTGGETSEAKVGRSLACKPC